METLRNLTAKITHGGRVSLLASALATVCHDRTLRDQGNPRPSTVRFLFSSTRGRGKKREVVPEAGLVKLFITFILLFWCVGVCLLCVPQLVCGGQSRFSLSNMWAPGIESRSSGLVASALSCWAISLAPEAGF